MRNYLIIDGMDSTDFGLYVSGPGTFSAPAREVQTLQIPGRSGDLIVTANRLQNYDLVYPAFICRDFERNIENLRNFLLSRTSYFRLEDSYHTDEYRQAMYVGPFDQDVTQRLRAAKFDLVFNVKPQRFLKSGEKTRQLGAADTYVLRNPTQFIARPILRLYGNGTFRLNTLNYFTVTNNAAPAAGADDDQISFSDVGADEVRRALLEIDLNTLTPIEGMNLLFELQRKARA